MNFELTISKDFKEAYITIKDYQGVTKKSILNEFLNSGVVSGVNFEKLQNILDNKMLCENEIIASYTPPVNGENDKIEILVETEVKPKEEKNKINYYNLGFLKDIEKGETLLLIHKGKKAVNGKLINGSEIEAVKGKEIDLESITGKGCIFEKVSDNTYAVKASINGCYQVKKNKVFVTDLIIINSGLNFKTGNLITNFSNIYIKGDVANSFTASSPKDIIIEGNIENSEIIAGNLIVKKNITKGDKRIYISKSLKASGIINRKNLYCGYLEIKESLLGSNIGVSESATIDQISGGETFVNNILNIRVLGSEISRNTTIIMGINKFEHDNYNKTYKNLRVKRAYLRKMRIEKVKLINEIDELRIEKRKASSDSRDYFEMKIEKLRKELELFDSDLEKLTNEEIILLKENNMYKIDEFNPDAVINVKEKIHPGTVIKFGPENSIRIRKERGPCKIYIGSEHEIIITDLNI